MNSHPWYSCFFTFAGVTCSMVFSALGACYGTAKSGTGIAGMGVFKPSLVMKALIPVIMSGILGIYGMVVSFMIMGSLDGSKPMSLFSSAIYLASGLCVGLGSLASGYTIGIVGSVGIIGFGQQPKLFIGMVLILIFAEVLGLYGLITSIILVTNA